MSVFDNTTRVRRAVADPAKDHRLPHPAALSWEAIGSAHGLKGTKGLECDLVHGDHFRRITGNRTDVITGNARHVVDRDQIVRINGKHNETLTQACYQNIVGPHIVFNQTVRNETHMGARTLIYGDFINEDTNNGDLVWATSLFEHTNILNFEWSTNKVEAHGIHVEVKAAHVAGSLIEAQTSVSSASESVYRLLDEKIVTKIDALVSDISLVTGQLGVLQARLGVVLTPCDANGTPLC